MNTKPLDTQKSLVSTLTRVYPFILLLAVYQLFLLVMLLLFGYGKSFLLINALHVQWLDLPMFLLTHLGDSLILTPIIALFLVRRNPAKVIIILIVVLLTGLIAQWMKEFPFSGWDRPLFVFGDKDTVHTIANYKLFHNSFPSGHSVTAAASITAVVLLIPLPAMMQILLAFCTILISYTRIYVGVHFAGDVLAGTLIGETGALIMVPVLQKWLLPPGRADKQWLKIVLLVMAVIAMVAGLTMAFSYL